VGPTFISPFVTKRSDYASLIQSQSDAIRVSRVLCIFFMCYVHIHVANLNPIIEAFVRNVLGRSSVPLLSLLSGLLMIGYFRKPLGLAIWLRFQSLVIPMFVWGAIGTVIFYALGGKSAFSINDLLPLWGSGKMTHLAFLRDLFVLLLITPLLIAMLKRSPFFLLALLSVGLWAPIEPILLRPQILTFYALGLFLGIYRIPTPQITNIVAIIAFVSATVLIVVFDLNNWAIDNLLLRPFTAWTFWLLAIWIAHSRFKLFFLKVEPAVFLLFLSHVSAGKILIGIYSQLDSGFLDTIVWLMAPSVIFAIVYRVHKLLTEQPILKSFCLFITGKKSASKDKVSH